MASAVNCVEDVCNLALAGIGASVRINDIWEGTAASLVALDIYAQTRDEVIREQDWTFALRTATLSLVATVSPTLGFSLGFPFTYTWPADCLRVRALVPTTLASPNNDPSWVDFTVYDDATLGRVILTAQANAIAVYAAQIVDMTQWDPLFTDALVTRLGRIFLTRLGNSQLMPLAAQAAEMARDTGVAATEILPPSNVRAPMMESAR